MTNDSEQLLTVDDAAAVLNVSGTWVYRHLGELPTIRLGRGANAPIRFDRSALRHWMGLA